MHYRSTYFFSLLAGLGLGACSGTDATLTDTDSLDTATSSLTEDLSPADGASYVRLRRDLRRCAAPLCGGFFVARVNHLDTACADGKRQAECYVAELDLSALGLSSEQSDLVRNEPNRFVLRGDIVSESSRRGELGRLAVEEAWQGHADTTANGAFLRVKNQGIVCITAPCLSFSAELLNRRVPNLAVADVDLSGVTPDPSDAFAQLNAPDGLLVAARSSLRRGPAGRARGLDASEYYLPLRPTPVACGSRREANCEPGSFCNFPPESLCGRADGPGMCQAQTEFCIEIFAPVCGCDGQTYDNSCFAAAAGVSVETEGACAVAEPSAAACGSRGLAPCAADSYCAFPQTSDCGRADAPGTCTRRPEACTQLFDPVCGCDGQTHGNACNAASAGVSVDFPGSCDASSE